MSETKIDVVYGCAVLRPTTHVRFIPETRRERFIRGLYQLRSALISITLRAGFILSLVVLAKWVIHG